jgi:hypothetical protein
LILVEDLNEPILKCRIHFLCNHCGEKPRKHKTTKEDGKYMRNCPNGFKYEIKPKKV